MPNQIQTSDTLRDVKYEIRGQLASHAHELEKRGYEIISLNIGNPGLFGFRTPETMRLAMIENLGQAEPYCHQKGIFPAREAVVMQQQDRGIEGISAEEVFIGNGVSELIDLSLRALLNQGDEVLIPSPDYPLWSAAVALNGGVVRYYDCAVERGFLPSPTQIDELIGPRTKAIVVINPNNPSGAVYDKDTLQQIARIAEQHGIVVLADEIYDQMVYDDAEFIHGMELLAALRLCSNVPGQWAVQTALGGFQSIRQLVEPGGRLYQSRKTVIDRVAQSPYLGMQPPTGAMYAFIQLDEQFAERLDDKAFARQLLEEKHVLVAPDRIDALLQQAA